MSGTTLSVSAVLTGSLQAGDDVSGTDGTNSLLPDTTIIEQLSGTAGGLGTYELSQAPLSGILNSCEVTSASTVLNATVIASGVLQPGQTLADLTGGLLAGTLITGQLQGTTGAPGLYSISEQQTVASEAMTTSMTLLAQVQPLTATALRHVDMLNLQGQHLTLYLNAQLHGGVRVAVKGGDLVRLADGSVYLVTEILENWSPDGWGRLLITMQDGS